MAYGEAIAGKELLAMKPEEAGERIAEDDDRDLFERDLASIPV